MDDYAQRVVWLTAEAGAVVLGLREFGVSPIVDLAGADVFGFFAIAALLAGGISIYDKIDAELMD